jgi:HPt (histidine-containing phosphotransfer) domain-containing protein
MTKAMPDKFDDQKSATGNTAGDDCLDQAIIGRLSANRPALLKRLIEVYLNHSPNMIAELQSAVDANDAAKLKLAAHSLKSSSANVGAARLSSLALEIERLAIANEVAKAAALVRSVHQRFSSVASALRDVADKCGNGKVAAPA